MYNSLLPVIKTNRKNVELFLDKMVFFAPNHVLSEDAYNLLVDYELLALENYDDKTQKPRSMGEQLKGVKVPVHILMGDKDQLFPFEPNLKIAKELLKQNIKSTRIFNNVSHGIECCQEAIAYVGEKVKGELIH